VVDYLDTVALARALQGVEAVVHIAGLAHISSKLMTEPLAVFRASNVDIALSVAKASIQSGVKKLLLLSSAGVLGSFSPPNGFNESSPPSPYDAYTLSKFEAEQQVLEVARGKIAVTILRPPMVYGPGAPGSYRRLCAWIDRRLPLPIASISARRSFVGIRNLCDLLVTIAVSHNEITNGSLPMLVADSEPLTVADFARHIAFVQGKSAVLLPVPPRLLEWMLGAAGLAEEYRRLALPFELRPTQARSVFGWQPPYSVREELTWALET
jgi:nucleoside-diphosphate-sugar epimerase